MPETTKFADKFKSLNSKKKELAEKYKSFKIKWSISKLFKNWTKITKVVNALAKSYCLIFDWTKIKVSQKYTTKNVL